MKFEAIAVIATATALSLGMAGSAVASPLSHEPKPAPQVGVPVVLTKNPTDIPLSCVDMETRVAR